MFVGCSVLLLEMALLLLLLLLLVVVFLLVNLAEEAGRVGLLACSLLPLAGGEKEAGGAEDEDEIDEGTPRTEDDVVPAVFPAPETAEWGSSRGGDQDGEDAGSPSARDPDSLSAARAANDARMWPDLRIDVGLRRCCFCLCAAGSGQLEELGRELGAVGEEERGSEDCLGADGVWVDCCCCCCSDAAVLEVDVPEEEEDAEERAVDVDWCGSSELEGAIVADADPDVGEKDLRRGDASTTGEVADRNAVSGW